MKLTFVTFLLICLSASLFAQNKDKSEFINVEPGFYQNSILKDVNAVNESLKPQAENKRFQMAQDTTGMPLKLSNYKSYWRNAPVSQGNTGTCWCFSTTSYMESEEKRIFNKEVKLSEMFTVYCEYIEKARRFVREHGESVFAEGSESNALRRMYSMYGAMPQSTYTGLINGRKYHSHELMYNEMMSFLNTVKSSNSWNEEWVLNTIKSIMNHHLGTPPATFTVDGKEYTPQTYLKDYLKLNMDDYVDVLSIKQEPYWKMVEYKVSDNWWHSEDYCNVPLDVFMSTLKNAVRNGFTVCIGGDVSESGFSRATQAAVIPDFDIPWAYINEDARQFRFTNQTTTDDHGIHLVGYVQKDGKDWYLIKDSGSGSRNNNANAPEFGYYFFREDYVKLKMMDFVVHKDMAKEILQKMNKK